MMKLVSKVKSHNGVLLEKGKYKCEFGHVFSLSARSVLKGKWCTQCGASKGERLIYRTLKRCNIRFVPNYTITSLPKRYYDFCFILDNEMYIIEFDGIQHFKFISHYHKTKKEFKKYQEIDILKTVKALESGYKIIRIDYNNISKIPFHIRNGILSTSVLYLSDEKMYDYLTLHLQFPTPS